MKPEAKKMYREIIADKRRKRNKKLTPEQVMKINIQIRQLRNLQRLAQI